VLIELIDLVVAICFIIFGEPEKQRLFGKKYGG